MSIAENIGVIREKIEKSALKSGRKPDEITLIGVSKTIDVLKIKEAVNCGIKILGENKPQELRDKFTQISDVHWHMIGHLQTNKVKYLIGKADLIHSVDSFKLIDEIDRIASLHNIVQDVLIQINISEQESKSGIRKDELDKYLEYAEKHNNIAVRGLMTIGSQYATEYELKKMFEICNKIFIDNKAKTYHNISMDYLSMGMTGDFEYAIEMGSNMIRIGSGIFGARNYNI